MPLETAGFVTQLVATNPPGTDQKKQGDDHLRLIKAALKATFPNADRAITFNGGEERFAGTVEFTADENQLDAHNGKLIFYDLTGGNRTYSLIAVASVADGFWSFIDRSDSANTLTIDAAGAELINGVASIVVPKGKSGILHATAAGWRFLYTESAFTAFFAQLILLTAAGLSLTLQTDADGATYGPVLKGYRNSPTPLALDQGLTFEASFEDSVGNEDALARMYARLVSPTSGAEAGAWIWETALAGAIAERMGLGAGLYMAGTLDPGAGKVNATAYQVAGVQVANATLQRTYDAIVGPQASTTGQTDVDDTPPLISEGDQLFTRAITPKVITSRIRITGNINWCHESGAGAEIIFALYKDNTLLRVWRGEQISNSCMTTALEYEEVSGSLTARTYSLRWGASTAAAHTLNVGADGFDMGDLIASSFCIEEYLA